MAIIIQNEAAVKWYLDYQESDDFVNRQYLGESIPSLEYPVYHKQTPLHLAVLSGRKSSRVHKNIINLILESGGKCWMEMGDEMTPLSLAVECRDAKSVKDFLDCNVPVKTHMLPSLCRVALSCVMLLAVNVVCCGRARTL